MAAKTKAFMWEARTRSGDVKKGVMEAESEEAMLAWQARIAAAGKTCLGPVDHGFVRSVYMYDPNGIQVEITCRAPRYAEILAAIRATKR